MYKLRSGKGLGKLCIRTLSEPASQLDDVDRQSELPDISLPGRARTWPDLENAEMLDAGKKGKGLPLVQQRDSSRDV